MVLSDVLESQRREAEALGLHYPEIEAGAADEVTFVLPRAHCSESTGIHYELRDPDEGRGTAPAGLVVFIHGIGAHGSVDWQLMAPACRAAGFRTLVFDTRGRGRSHQLLGQLFDLEDHVGQIEELMEDLSLTEEPHTVVCHSMGAIIGAAYCAGSSAAVNALVLLAPAGTLVTDPGAAAKALDCCGGCCLSLAAKVLSGPPPPNADYAHAATEGATTVPPSGVEAAVWLERGRVLEQWMLAWHAAARRAQHPGGPLVMSAARMPFSDVLGAVRARNGSQSTVPIRALPVLVMAAPGDPTIGQIKGEDYQQMFGDQVVLELNEPGLHCFHLQNADNVHRKVLQFLHSVLALPQKPPGDDSGSDRMCM